MFSIKNSNEGTINMQITLVKNHVAQRTPFRNVCNNPLQKVWHCLKDKYIAFKKCAFLTCTNSCNMFSIN